MFIDYGAREINFKLVYYGPGLAGKTTNIQHVHDRTAPDARSRLISLATETERTFSFSFKPATLGQLRGLGLRFHLYTVPGPVFHDASRRLILRHLDGVVFVADSQEARIDADVEWLEDLETGLVIHGLDPARVPTVLQYNKRDAPTAAPLDLLDAALNPAGRERFEAVATAGTGVFETLKAVCRQVLAELRRGTALP